MATETLKEFLVSVGFKVDESTWRRFERTIEGATLRAKLLGDAIEAMAKTVASKVEEVAESLEGLAYQAQRVGASVAHINAFRFAISQVGGTASQANSMLEGFGRAMRENPRGMEQYLKSLGIQTRDAAGHLLDSSDILLNAGKKFDELVKRNPVSGQAQASKIAGMMGLSGDDALVLERQTGLRDNFNKGLASGNSAGIGGDLADMAVKFEQALGETEKRLTDFATGAEGKLMGALKGPLEELNKYLDEHKDQINDELGKIATSLAQAAEGWARGIGQIDWSKAEGGAKNLATEVAQLVADFAHFSDELSKNLPLLKELLGAFMGARIGSMFGPLGALFGAGAGAVAAGVTDGTGRGGPDSVGPGGATNPYDKGGDSLWGRLKKWWNGGADTQSGAPYNAKSFADGTGISSDQYIAFREGVAQIEHSRYGQMGGGGGRFAGRYQMGAAEIRETAQRLGEPVPSTQQFLSDPAMQERYMENYTLDHYNQLMRSPIFRAMSPEDKLKILGYAHNQGVGGALNYLRSGQAGRDAFGTSGEAYFAPIETRLKALQQSKVAGSRPPPSWSPVGSAQAGTLSWDQPSPAWGSINNALPVGAGGVTNVGGDKTVSSTVNNNVTVNAPDPHTAAAMVGMHLDRTATDVQRNLAGAAQ